MLGVYPATLLDSARGCAVHSALGSEQACSTLVFKVAYHRALSEYTGPVRDEGKVVSIRKRVAPAATRLTDQPGRL